MSPGHFHYTFFTNHPFGFPFPVLLPLNLAPTLIVESTFFVQWGME